MDHSRMQEQLQRFKEKKFGQMENAEQNRTASLQHDLWGDPEPEPSTASQPTSGGRIRFGRQAEQRDEPAKTNGWNEPAKESSAPAFGSRFRSDGGNMSSNGFGQDSSEKPKFGGRFNAAEDRQAPMAVRMEMPDTGRPKFGSRSQTSAPADHWAPNSGQNLESRTDEQNNRQRFGRPNAQEPSRDSVMTGHTGPAPNNMSAEEEQAAEAAEASLLRKLMACKIQAVDPSRLQINSQTDGLWHTKSSWQELHVPATLVRGLVLNGFDTPSLIQSVALDFLFKGKNLIAQSQSGTGKTVAFVVGMLHRVDPNEQYPQAIVLEPTFELAKQTAQVIRSVVEKAMNVTVIEAVRGAARFQRGDQVTDHVIVGTPGTVLDWLTRFRVFDPSKIKVFVLDEADVMIAQQGHQDQSVRIFKAMDPNTVQTALFSATYDPAVMDFAIKIVRNPEVITVKPEELSLETIHQYYVNVSSDEEKIRVLRSLYGMITVDNAIVFCRSRAIAHQIYDALKPDGHPIGILAGDMDVEARHEAINRFRDGKDRLLITTNVSARGIDVMSVNLVVNFDLPITFDRKPDYETYIHRIGRTGRFGRGGLAINFVKDDRDITTLRAFESYFRREIVPLDHADIDQLEKLNEEASRG